MMDLMLKQMKQQPVEPLALNALTAVDVNDAIEIGHAQALDHGNQSPIHFHLCISEHHCGAARLRVGPGRRPERPALHGVHVKEVDNQDVIERSAQAWKETGSRRHEIGLRQPPAGREQTMVGPAIVVSHGTVRKGNVHQRLRNPDRSKF